jgi:hypothetical protein
MGTEYAEKLDFEHDNLWDTLVVKEYEGGSRARYDSIIDRLHKREEFTKRYAWAIPTRSALDVIAKYGPLVEMGAGTGYWAYELLKRGVTIEPYDKYPPDGGDWSEAEIEEYYGGKHPNKNWYHRGETPWTTVLQGTPDILKSYDPQWNLFLCWPPYDDEMAAYALGYHRGEFICYVGESEGGCNGDRLFWRLINRLYDEVETETIPQWPGIHDYVAIYKRKGR